MNESSYGMASLADWVGKELGTSKWVPVDQERINTFARCRRIPVHVLRIPGVKIR